MNQRAFSTKKSAAAVFHSLMGDTHGPASAMIEIADRCNEVCIHCYQVQGQKGEMSTEQVKRVIDDLADMGVMFLVLSGGEPTLRNDFLELVAHARQRRFALKIYSNGLSIDRDLARKLGDLAVQEVQMSLYSHRAEVHDWVTRVPGSFEKTTAAARHLVEAGVHVVLKTPLMSFNVDEYDEYIEFVTSLGADFSLDPIVKAREEGDRSPTAFRVSDAAYRSIKSDTRLRLRKLRTAPPEVPVDAKPCGACSGSVHIEANGEIRPCTQLTVPTGHALHEGVRRAWLQNEDARFIRQLTWADLHGCRSCDLRSYCKRCHADAQHEAGDALGPYEYACSRARLEYEMDHGMKLEITGDPSIARCGPYKKRADGTFQAVPDVITDRDREIAERYPWIRTGADDAPGARAAPGALVQLRRPGKGPAVERIPEPERSRGNGSRTADAIESMGSFTGRP